MKYSNKLKKEILLLPSPKGLGIKGAGKYLCIQYRDKKGILKMGLVEKADLDVKFSKEELIEKGYYSGLDIIEGIVKPKKKKGINVLNLGNTLSDRIVFLDGDEDEEQLLEISIDEDLSEEEILKAIAKQTKGSKIFIKKQ